MFTSVSMFGEWAAETEAAGNGTGDRNAPKQHGAIRTHEI